MTRSVQSLREKLATTNPFNELREDLAWALDEIERLRDLMWQCPEMHDDDEHEPPGYRERHPR